MTKFLFQMDDPRKINIKEDSTYLIIKEAISRGIKCFYNNPNWIHADLDKTKKIKSKVCKIFLKKNNQPAIVNLTQKEINLDSFDVVFVRQDPPFNLQYISNTYLLDQLKKPLIINNPKEIRNYPEKHIMMNFPELTPPTLISSELESIIDFIKKHEVVVIKPAYGNGGIGIEKINKSKKDLRSFIKKYINKFSKSPVIVQKFLNKFYKGDKRIILVNGNIKGAVLRIPKKNSIKANFHAGGTALKTSLSKKDKLICKKIKNFLIKNKLYLAGIDVIDGYLTEINITSPTGIQEINRLNKVKIEKDIVDFVIKLLK
tara:strand:+ start:85 stop:1032 length:948 start_codon:yes stop_codon:yes gene_type:complete